MTGFWFIPKPAISCIKKFLSVLAVFVCFCRFARSFPLCILFRVPLGTKKQPEKHGNYNIYSNGQSQKFFNVMTGFWLTQKIAISCFVKFFVCFCALWPICPILPFFYTSADITGDNKQPGKSGNQKYIFKRLVTKIFQCDDGVLVDTKSCYLMH